MTPHSKFRTPREACYEIGTIADSAFKKLIRRPWNLFEPEVTSWWLVPSADWPAFRYGKYYFNWGKGEATTLLFGLFIEKGLDPSIKAAYPSRKGSRYIMGKDWAWFSLLEAVKNRSFEKIIREIAQNLPFPIEFLIDGGNVPDPESFNPYAPRINFDVYNLVWNNQEGYFSVTDSQTDAKLLTELERVKSFDDLSTALENLNTNPWLWVDFYPAIRLLPFPLSADTGKDQTVWDEKIIWGKFLSPLAPFVI